MIESRTLVRMACFVVAALAFGAPRTASAHLIGPGFDLFSTVPEKTYFILPGPAGGQQQIHLRGDPTPILPLFPFPFNRPLKNNTDTIVQRHQGADIRFPDGVATIPIELVALSLVSVAPVPIGGGLYEVRATGGSLLDPANPSPLGSMTIVHSDPNGGTFTSTLPVLSKITFTPIFGPPIPEFFDLNIFTSGGFQAPLSFWSHTPGPYYPESGMFLSGDFYAGVHPLSGEKVLTEEESMLAAHGVLPAQPAPGVLPVLLVGGLLAGRRRRR